MKDSSSSAPEGTIRTECLHLEISVLDARYSSEPLNRGLAPDGAGSWTSAVGSYGRSLGHGGHALRRHLYKILGLMRPSSHAKSQLSSSVSDVVLCDPPHTQSRTRKIRSQELSTSLISIRYLELITMENGGQDQQGRYMCRWTPGNWEFLLAQTPFLQTSPHASSWVLERLRVTVAKSGHL